ncbi:gamma-carboxygeranoyl-CoA hydratase [Endozoicomonas sp. (ex Bugula neritina AB1)]|nr:gamma-carboxygeranoyl-CoA hydratase [Endozoicomonas sp. (ex Bugula neritina AB1)]
MSNKKHNKKLIVETHQSGLASLTLNRPEAGNAFDAELIQELIVALKALEEQQVRLLVIKSTGKHFSTGADLNWMRASRQLSHEENLDDARQLAELLRRLNRFPAPTLAMAQGAVYGGAVGLITACDIALAADTARFCLSEVKIGLMPAVISPYVVAAMGERQARRYFLTAEVFSSLQAQQLGLVHECCRDNQVEVKASTLCKQILGNSPLALAAAKSLIREVSHQSINDSLIETTCQRIADIRVTEEAQEGLSAFLEKRTPSWRLGG